MNKNDIILQLDTQAAQLDLDNLKEKISLKESQIKAKQLNLNKSINDINAKYQLLSLDLESQEILAARFSRLKKNGVSSEQKLLEAQLHVKKTKVRMQQLQQSIDDLQSTTEAEITGLELEKNILGKQSREQQRLLQSATVRAPRDGILNWIKNIEGASINAGEPIAKIADAKRFRIEATLSDFYSSQLHQGMQAEIIYNDHKIMAHLETLSPTIENGVMKLIIALDKPENELLRANLRVDVGIITDSIADAYILLKGPFVNGAGQQEVFVIKDDIAYKTPINIGLSNSHHYQILSGLNKGDEVIISDVTNFIHLNSLTIN